MGALSKGLKQRISALLETSFKKSGPRISALKRGPYVWNGGPGSWSRDFRRAHLKRGLCWRQAAYLPHDRAPTPQRLERADQLPLMGCAETFRMPTSECYSNVGVHDRFWDRALDLPGRRFGKGCINSASLRFIHLDELGSEGYGQLRELFQDDGEASQPCD